MASKLVVPVPVPVEAAAERVPLLSRQTVHLQTDAYKCDKPVGGRAPLLSPACRAGYPLGVPAHHFEKGRADPDFRTKLAMAVELVRQAVNAGISFRAVVADCFYGEDHGVQQGLRDLGTGYVLALKPSHAWWHPIDTIGSLREAAEAAEWNRPTASGEWVQIERTFRDGHTETWWALEVDVGPYGPTKPIRAVVATTDPATLPDHTTWYLTTNLPAPGSARAVAASASTSSAVLPLSPTRRSALSLPAVTH